MREFLGRYRTGWVRDGVVLSSAEQPARRKCMVDTSQRASAERSVVLSMRQFEWSIIAFNVGAFVTIAALIVAVVWM